MDEKTKNTLRLILNTLNQISVSGEANIDKMLGAIITLRQLVNQPGQTQEEETEES